MTSFADISNWEVSDFSLNILLSFRVLIHILSQKDLDVSFLKNNTLLNIKIIFSGQICSIFEATWNFGSLNVLSNNLSLALNLVISKLSFVDKSLLSQLKSTYTIHDCEVNHWASIDIGLALAFTIAKVG